MSQIRAQPKSKEITTLNLKEATHKGVERILIEEFSEERGDGELKKNFIIPYLQDLIINNDKF